MSSHGSDTLDIANSSLNPPAAVIQPQNPQAYRQIKTQIAISPQAPQARSRPLLESYLELSHNRLQQSTINRNLYAVRASIYTLKKSCGKWGENFVMLKSTYKPPVQLAPLPGSWTQHQAPDGRPYYYNDTTKQSTYIRPTDAPKLDLPSFHAPSVEVFGQDHDHHATGNNTITNGRTPPFVPYGTHSSGHHDPPRGDHRFQKRPKPKDRPKKKSKIPGCSPWLLVQTRLGRRFVHNPESGESFWRFPSDVMKAVVEYDRLLRENGNTDHNGGVGGLEIEAQVAIDGEAEPATDQIPTASMARATLRQGSPHRLVDSDGEEYEEVEVTDDEDDDHQEKRHKTNEGDDNQPVEFIEDDIAYQLAAMGEDYGLDSGEFGNGEGEDLEEGAEGLGLTEEDSKALFKDLLNDYQISPYTAWDKIIEAGHIIEDDRYTVLPNMKSRKEVWDEWSRDMIQRLKDQREKEEKKDPRIPYFAFLQSHATPKLYWPEFRRKYKKEPEIHSTKLSDKDREKWYREYISRLRLPESTLKADLIKLLKATPLQSLNRSTTVDSLPPSICNDLRYMSLRQAIRDPLIEAHISYLPPPPSNPSLGEAECQAGKERERRERALANRQAQVQEEKRRQRGALQYSRGMLREGEEEVQRALRVGKEGLAGYMEG